MSDLYHELDDFSRTVIASTVEAFPDAIREVVWFRDELTLDVERDSVLRLCRFLRDAPQLTFKYLADLSAVDMWPEKSHLQVNIHLLVLGIHGHQGLGARRLRVKVCLDRDDAHMASLSEVWPSTAWYEREASELFGIQFHGHPDPRPLLLPDDWKGTPPLRRDVPVKVEEVAFSFNQNRIYRAKPFASE